MLDRLLGKSRGIKRSIAVICFLVSTVAKMVPELAGLATICEQLGIGFGVIGMGHAMTTEKVV